MSGLKDSAFGDTPFGDFENRQPYPRGPGVKSVHSLESANKIAPKVGPQQALVLKSLNEDGPATPDEVGIRIGISLLNARPRCTELSKLGLIERVPDASEPGGFLKRANAVSGHRAVVWRAKPDR
jgi:hypothetical protein